MSTTSFPPAGDWIRGISVKQPHATAILTGAKTIENRPQAWSWRSWLLLHTSQQIDRTALRVPLIARAVRGRDLTTGAVIGVARLTGCHQDPDGSPPCTEFAQPGAWHLELSDVQALALPIPARGQLGPWRPTEDLVAQVLQQLPHLRP
ncbi:hypothetical protein AB4225_29095 [Streptomyces sp. 2RAF24]|uniref:hypothetical protein n=1 Tax=Streptomyces sp. 2RAF24 TaxID=3232997 RepID=UPI003F99B440